MADEVALRYRLLGNKAFARDVDADIRRPVRGVTSDVSKAEHASRLFNSATGRLRTGLIAAGSAAATAGGLIFWEAKRATQAWEESRKVQADTVATIKSTGGAANVTADHIARLSGKISGLTGVDDEAIQSGANMLLTFKNIRNEGGKVGGTLDQTIGLLSDVAVKMDKEPKQAAIMLGKALNDPIKGMTALGRAGVQFSAADEKRIERLVKENKLREAQGIILKELRSQFGGQAAAQGTALDKLHTNVENLEEAIGSGLEPITDRLFTGITNRVDEVTPVIEKFGKGVADIFGRDDLDIEQKLALSSRRAQRSFGPLVDDWGDEFKQLLGGREFGEALGDGFDAAAPFIADHIVHTAPVLAERFATAWWNADTWTKVFSASFLLTKMGAFGTVGRIAAGRFGGGFSGGLKGNLAGAAGRGSTPLNPIFVEDVTGSGSGPGGLPTKLDKTPGLVSKAKTVGKLSGLLLPGILLAESGIMPNNDYATTGADAARRRAAVGPGMGSPGALPDGRTATSVNVDGHAYPVDPRLTGYRDAGVAYVQTEVKLDGEVVARANHKSELRTKGRR